MGRTTTKKTTKTSKTTKPVRLEVDLSGYLCHRLTLRVTDPKYTAAQVVELLADDKASVWPGSEEVCLHATARRRSRVIAIVEDCELLDDAYEQVEEWELLEHEESPPPPSPKK